jgi:hypothetical protein
MLQKYKEITYGVLFGVGAVIIDALMDAHMDAEDFSTALVGHRAMLLYRLLFIAYGLIFGFLLWQRSRRERDFRHLAEAFKRIRLECGRIALLIHANMQLLLTRDDFHLPHEAEGLVRFAYERSHELQVIANEGLSINPLNHTAGGRVTSSAGS